jgi:hypothetical protein
MKKSFHFSSSSSSSSSCYKTSNIRLTVHKLDLYPTLSLSLLSLGGLAILHTAHLLLT